jgi:hypothetical protein
MMEYVQKEDFEKLEERVTTHTEKLAQCKLDQHKQDHDTLTILSENNKYVVDKLRRVTEMQEKLNDAQKETAGQLNLVTDKVVILNNSESNKKKWILGILSGIIIALLSGVVMMWITYTMGALRNNMGHEIDQKIDVLMDKILDLEKERKAKDKDKNDK